MKKKTLIILIEIMVLLLLGTAICMLWKRVEVEQYQVVWQSPIEMQTSTEELQTEVGTRTVTLTAIGDVMMHQWQITRGYDAATDTFDYADSFQYVESYLSEADFTFGNLETTFAGRYIRLFLLSNV